MTANPGAAFADIVEAASAVILPLWRSGLTVDTKSDDSPVTEADRRGEEGRQFDRRYGGRRIDRGIQQLRRDGGGGCLGHGASRDQV